MGASVAKTVIYLSFVPALARMTPVLHSVQTIRWSNLRQAQILGSNRDLTAPSLTPTVTNPLSAPPLSRTPFFAPARPLQPRPRASPPPSLPFPMTAGPAARRQGCGAVQAGAGVGSARMFAQLTVHFLAPAQCSLFTFEMFALTFCTVIGLPASFPRYLPSSSATSIIYSKLK